MEMFSEIIDYIARTNLFNFVIFLAIILLICKKANVMGKIEQAKDEIHTVIEESKTTKIDSETRLSSIEESMTHLEEEIESILNLSDENAKLVGEKIVQEAEKTITGIHNNALKAIENSKQILKNDLIKRASLASVEVAKSQIINELNGNSELHDRLIEESINTLEGVQL